MSLCVINGSEAFPKRLVEGSGHQGSMPTGWNPLPKDLEHPAGEECTWRGSRLLGRPVGGRGHPAKCKTGSHWVPGFLGAHVQ